MRLERKWCESPDMMRSEAWPQDMECVLTQTCSPGKRCEAAAIAASNA